MSRKKIIQAHYEPRIAPGRASHDVLDWSDGTSQRKRFAVLCRCVDLAGKTLLDVGCGLGDLWGYLQARRIPADYTGVDIVDKMVRAARRKHPDRRFRCVDIFNRRSFRGKRFDVVFCSGAFNLDLGNNLQFLPQAAARLMELAKEAVVFNLLHHRTKRRHAHCFYYDPTKVRAAVRALGCRVRIVEDYLPNDFTVVCRLRRAKSSRKHSGGKTRRRRHGMGKKG